MPDLDKQALANFIQSARSMGKSDAEIETFVRTKLPGYGAARIPQYAPNPADATTLNTGSSRAATHTMEKQAIGQTLGMAAGSMLPGALGVTGMLGRAALLGAGRYIGGTLGGVLTGQSPDEARTQAAISTGIGGAVEGGLNLATRGLGSMGGVQQPAVSQALEQGTRQGARTMFGKPSTTAEAELGGRIAESLKPKNVGITEGRLATTNALDAMQESGAGVTLSDTLHALNESIEKLSQGGIGSGARASLTRLKGIRADLITKYIDESAPVDVKGGLMGQETVGRTTGRPPRLTIDPQEADYINQQIQDAVGNAYGKAGGKESVRTLKGVGAAHTESFRRQTGTAESAAATTRRLEAIESMRKQISQTTPESFVRSVGDAIMTQGESGDQSALIALREFDKSGALEAQIKQLASQREWTGSQSRTAHNIKWEFIRRLPRFAAKLTGVAARPAGNLAAAGAAFTQAMQPKNNP